MMINFSIFYLCLQSSKKNAFRLLKPVTISREVILRSMKGELFSPISCLQLRLLSFMINQDLFLKDLARHIKVARERVGKTQIDVLMDTGIHIGRIEQGDSSIQLYTYYRICKYLDIDPAYVINELEIKYSFQKNGSTLNLVAHKLDKLCNQ